MDPLNQVYTFGTENDHTAFLDACHARGIWEPSGSSPKGPFQVPKVYMMGYTNPRAPSSPKYLDPQCTSIKGLMASIS